MPTFSLPVIALYPGDTFDLFASTESLTAPATSKVIAVSVPGQLTRWNMTFQGDFASAPTAEWKVFGSNTSPDSTAPKNGVLLYDSTNKQHDNYTDNLAFAWYWAQLVTQSGGGAFSLTVHIG